MKFAPRMLRKRLVIGHSTALIGRELTVVESVAVAAEFNNFCLGARQRRAQSAASHRVKGGPISEIS